MTAMDFMALNLEGKNLTFLLTNGDEVTGKITSVRTDDNNGLILIVVDNIHILPWIQIIRIKK
jgi:hypothetical protein